MSFTPRLTSTGMQGSKYWYSNTNPFFAAGLGLPNCTAYSWGRFWEETPDYIPKLPTRDAKLWLGIAQQQGIYKTGSTPKLGAVICFGGLKYGHVAIVEEIKSNGDITTSNSDYYGRYFYIRNLKKSNNYNDGSLKFQGFIYNPHIDDTPPPEPPKPWKKRSGKFPWVLYSRKLRNRLDN